MADSQIRAYVAQTLVKRLERLPGSEGAAILAASASEERALLRELTSLSWTPLGLQLTLLDATLAHLGTEGFRTFYRDVTLENLQRQPISGLIATATKLLGLTPSSFAKMSSHGWEMSFRNAGRLRFMGGDGPRHAAIALEGLPETVFRASFTEAVVATFLCFYPLSRVKGSVQVRATPKPSAPIIFDLSWQDV